MKLATLRTAYGTTCIRVEEDAASPAGGIGTDLQFEDVGALLAQPDWRVLAQQSGEPVAFVPEDLAPVIPNPGKIICVGVNYAKHAREMGRELPEQPTLFIKFPEALTGPYDPIYLPPHAQAKPDYEGELAVVIGARTHRVTEEEALAGLDDIVAGYAIMNDYTLRDLQRATTQFHAGKSFYKSAGFGPWLTVTNPSPAAFPADAPISEIPVAQSSFRPGTHAKLRTFVDGQVRQDDDTDDLIFSIPKLIAFCSSLYPLNPGDVIVTGTPEGVGFARGEFLQHGQSVRIEIDGLGHIENRTLFEEAPHEPSSGGGSCGGACNC